MGRKDVPCPRELKKKRTCGAGAGSSATIGSLSFLIHFGGSLFIFLNSHFVGKVALELGPAPDGAFLFYSLVNQKVHEKGRRESCGALDRCILHRISVRTTLRWRHFF